MRWWRRSLTLALATAVSGYAYARQRTGSQIVVEQVPVPVANLPPALHGFTVVQLSDFHFSATMSAEIVQRSVAIANSLHPDIVVLTGDYSSRTPLLAYELAQMLAHLEPKLGTYAVRGNHDFVRSGVGGPVEHSLVEAGIHVLVNEGVVLTRGGSSIYVAGLDNLSWGKPDLHRTLAGAPQAAPVLLLVHEPDVADQIALDGRVTLQLSGHTHGGQICVPGGRPLILPENGRIYHTGLYRVRQIWVYTTRGIGVTRIPLRLNCPPEVTRLTLVPAPIQIVNLAS